MARQKENNEKSDARKERRVTVVCKSSLRCLLLFFIIVITGVFLTEFVPWGVRRYNFPHYYTISSYSSASFIIMIPFYGLLQLWKYLKNRRSQTSAAEPPKNENEEENLTDGEDEHEEEGDVSNLFLIVSSFFVTISIIIVNYFCYKSLDLIPPSLNLIIYSSDSVFTLLISMVLLWSIVKKNIILKILTCAMALFGLIFLTVADSQEESINTSTDKAVNYNYTSSLTGVIFALISVISVGLSDNLFILCFGDLSFERTVLLFGWSGVFGVISLPLLWLAGKLNMEPILSLSQLTNPYIWVFLTVAGINEVLYNMALYLLLQNVRSPMLVALCCMFCEVCISLGYDHWFLGVQYSYLMWIGAGILLVAVGATNFAEWMPVDVVKWAIRKWKRRKNMESEIV